MRERIAAWKKLLLAGLLLAQGCVAPQPGPDLLAPTDAQMKLRSFQSRTFEVTDRKVAMRGVIAALQDLGFIIERANEPLGLVTAARFSEPDNLSVIEVSVTIRPQTDGRMLVRANAIYNRNPVDDPKVYQNFFATLNRSLFINKEE